ncbi:hypothetical protein [Olsenella uli]|uniref:hypothetical protein n=1 Tax=Olsenella uli TaxID=133926 RepID=UPI003D7A2573
MNDRPRREIRPADGRRDLSTIRAAAPNDPAPSYEVEVEPQPSLSDWVTERPALKLALAAVLVVAMLISEFVLRPTYERPEAWEGIVLAVLYLEKYLLTILSTLAFGALIPLALGLFCAALLMHNNLSTSRVMRVAGTRVLVVAAVLLFLVPTSVWVTERVDSMHQSSIEQAETDAAANQDQGQDQEPEGEKNENKGFLDSLIDMVTDAGEALANGAQSITDSVVAQVNNLIEGAVVMIVTSCVIPLLVLVAFLWLGHALLGIDVSAPADALRRQMEKPMHRPTLGPRGSKR